MNELNAPMFRVSDDIPEHTACWRETMQTYTLDEMGYVVDCSNATDLQRQFLANSSFEYAE